MSKPIISIVSPCFNEEDNIDICYETIRTIFKEKLPQYNYEHIFCDNASTDNTISHLRRLAKKDKRVKIILNSRNFGPMRSNFNGVIRASGDAIITFMPLDLQDPPELIPHFVEKWEAGNHVVFGIRKSRQESFILRITRKFYYRIVTHLAGITIPKDAGDYQLIDKCVQNELKKHDDYYPYLRGMIANCGFTTIGINYTWRMRERNISKNNFFSLIDQALNGIISFTNVPMRLCMFIGFFIAFFSILYACIQLILNIIYFRQITEPGIGTLLIAVFFFSGIQLFFIGIIGEYISAIHGQVRKKPLVIEKELINF